MLSHHIRAYLQARRARRPHRQSAHMIGRTKFATGPEALVSAAVAAALFAVFSLVLTEPVPPEFPAPAQVASQK